MKRFTLQIDTENAAFSDYPFQEIVRILRQLADALETYEADESTGWLSDVNGNRVGYWGTTR